jgi:hypothetical protein
MIERAAEVIVLADSSKIDPNAVRWLNARDIEVKIARTDAAAA